MNARVPRDAAQESTEGRVPPVQAARAQIAAARQRRDALIASGVLPGACPDQPACLPGRIGRYHIKRAIASGGMGTVYEATQESPRRVVALKVMKHGIASRSALRRFEYEGQILGRLRHPGIAQIYEAGMHADDAGLLGPAGAGIPYFAMEYLPNVKPITRFAEEKELGTRKRLELFVQVCDAVHHGHQKGIIHRDLKPGNILVDSTGQVKVIDFGVARSTDSDMAVTTLQTDVGQLIGTLQYMSPEQCQADPHDIDIRSDVYALGVVLYELLSGRLPYTVTSARLYEGARIIREEQPTRLTTINKTLRGDIETIALKALEKERGRRYQSATEFGQDIQRYLNNEAITARRASMIYQLRVFARRNKGVFASLAALFVILTAGLIVSTSLYFGAEKARTEQTRERERAESERDRADQAAQTAKHVSGFLVDLFRVADPDEARSNTITVREILDRGTERITRELADQPLVRATLMNTMGKVYMNLGIYEKARPLLESALRTRREELGAEHLDVAESLSALGSLLRFRGERADSELAYREAIGIRREFQGGEQLGLAEDLEQLSVLLRRQRNYAEAESVCDEALAIRRKMQGPGHPDVASCLSYCADVRAAQGDPAGAEALLREALAICRKSLASDDPRLAQALNQLAYVLERRDEIAGAEALFREALSIRRKHMGKDDSVVAISANNLAGVLENQGKLVEAEALYREAASVTEEWYGAAHPNVAFFRDNLGNVLREQGRLSEAEVVLRNVVEKCNGWYCGRSHSNLGACLTEMGRFAEAERELLEAERASRDLPRHYLVDVIDRVVKLYDSWDRAEPGKGYDAKAAEWRTKLEDSNTAAEPKAP